MTVLAYSRKFRILATDSRCSDEETQIHLGNVRKIFRLKNGALLGTAGDGDDRAVRAILAEATPRNMPAREALAALKMEFEGLMIFPSGLIFMISIAYHNYNSEWAACVDFISDDVVAGGHGKEFAYAILDLGMSPQDAVRAACKRDTTCALPVQWASLDGPEEVQEDETTERPVAGRRKRSKQS